MGKPPKRQAFTHEQRIKAFVLRARRIVAHSLWREHRDTMEKLRTAEMKVNITQNLLTGETTYTHREEFPSEELLESLAARVRPLILESEELYYPKVLDSIATLVPAANFPDYVLPIEDWHTLWASVATRDESAQAYYIVTDGGAASDQDLMYAWLYGDVVHADDKEAEAKGLGIEQRYKAAAGIVTRIVECVESTLLLVQELIAEQVLTVDQELFEREVVVKRTVFETPLRQARVADRETPLPLHVGPLDHSIWTDMAEFVAPGIQAAKCATWWKTRGLPGPPSQSRPFPRQRVVLEDFDS
ncbi:hypothetical protein [Nocardia sp. NPDC047648]|uniref:hypothetical protein n=1 Tax=Nocardia sp. NPDC047648 TaxID=3155625 RepID=UPI0033E60234